jgi:hypothetical protein
MSAMVVKMTQTGLNNVLYDRHRVAKPNCKPISIPTNSRGMTKLVSAIVIIVTGMVLAFLIFLVEKCLKIIQTSATIILLNSFWTQMTKLAFYWKISTEIS